MAVPSKPTRWAFIFTIFDPQHVRRVSIFVFSFLPSGEFHIFRDRFAFAIHDPFMYCILLICRGCLPTIEFHIFRDRFTTAIIDPEVYCIFLICRGCLPTIEFYFVRYLFTFAIFDPFMYLVYICL